MFAQSRPDGVSIENSVKYHRCVQPITTLQKLTTIIKLFEIEQFVVGRIDPEYTDLEKSSDVVSDHMRQLISSAISQNQGLNEKFQKVHKLLGSDRLYATVFITDIKGRKEATLVLVHGPNDCRIKHIGVTEKQLQNAVGVK